MFQGDSINAFADSQSIKAEPWWSCLLQANGGIVRELLFHPKLRNLLKRFSILVAVYTKWRKFIQQQLANSNFSKEASAISDWRCCWHWVIQTWRANWKKKRSESLPAHQQQPMRALLVSWALRRRLSQGAEDQAFVVSFLPPKSHVGYVSWEVRGFRGHQLQDKIRMPRTSTMAQRHLLQVPAVSYHP